MAEQEGDEVFLSFHSFIQKILMSSHSVPGLVDVGGLEGVSSRISHPIKQEKKSDISDAFRL